MYHIETEDVYGNPCVLAVQASTPEQGIEAFMTYCQDRGIELYEPLTPDDLVEIGFQHNPNDPVSTPICLLRYNP